MEKLKDKYAKKVIDPKEEIEKGLFLNIGIETFKLNRWTKTPIIIKNNSNYNIKNLNIKILNEDFYIRKLDSINIEKTHQKPLKFI